MEELQSIRELLGAVICCMCRGLHCRLIRRIPNHCCWEYPEHSARMIWAVIPGHGSAAWISRGNGNLLGLTADSPSFHGRPNSWNVGWRLEPSGVFPRG